MNRTEELTILFTKCLKKSAIRFNNMPAIKYLCGKGIIFLIENNRKLDICEVMISNYCEDDEKTIREILNSNEHFDWCESHSCADAHYVYSVFLK